MLKRTFDFFVALAGLIVFFPVLVFVGVGVAIFLGRPVLFRQKRPGLNEEIFELVKFRTMKDAWDREGKPLPDEQRINAFGKLLRSSSLDELPELWNVLKGDMSLVGPRPLLVEYLPLYNERQRRRHEVRPGITGLAQVSGRNSLDWSSRFELDVRYVEKQSFILDLKILIKTFSKVLLREGISEKGQATMTKFEGNQK